MNRALLYLWWSLLQRRARGFFRSLRRPTSLIGALAVAAFLGILFYFRESKFMGELVRKQCLLGGALVITAVIVLARAPGVEVLEVP